MATTLLEFKKEFDIHLEEFLKRKVGVYRSYTDDPLILQLIEHGQRLILDGGKRIRPYMFDLLYQAAGGNKNENVIQIAVALEVFHFFLLVQDDVMDSADMRRGTPTIHQIAYAYLKKNNRPGDLKRASESYAVIIGDLMSHWATTTFFENLDIPNSDTEKAKQYFYQMVDEVVIGQAIDLDFMTRDTGSTTVN